MRDPSLLGMTTGSPASRTETTELVVPRSMPTALGMGGSSGGVYRTESLTRIEVECGSYNFGDVIAHGPPRRVPRCLDSCCSATARASGTSATCSRAGGTRTSPPSASRRPRPPASSWPTTTCAADVSHTSLQTRAIRTVELALHAQGRSWFPVRRDWRLNERHYGDLTGRNKAETAARYGDEQFKVWRRSYDVPPPPISPENEYNPNDDERYAQVPGRRAAADGVPGRRRRPAAPLLVRRDRARTCGPGTPSSSAPTATACAPS